MKTIGIIGGMSAESTAHYYAAINAGVRNRLGGLHSAEIIVWSVDFAEIAAMQEQGKWDEAGQKLAGIAKRLEAAGADVVLLATNTMHKVADAIVDAVSIPFIHIADATAAQIKRAGFKRPGLMATAYTMEQSFYVGRLKDRHGLDVVIPDEGGRADTHKIIYEELCSGVVRGASRQRYQQIAESLAERGADCLILGCTEVGMLLNDKNVSVPVFDTTLIHAEAAVAFALSRDMRKAAE
jgi:aspartate racemase